MPVNPQVPTARDANTSSSTGLSYQTAHTYFFVPSDFGTNTLKASDDVKTPGAFLRLGGYSDIETGAKTAGTLAQFYPRQHVEDEGDSAQDNAAGAGGAAARGIALACSGRLLIYSAEKAYVHSVGAMHIDTTATLTVHADQAIVVDTLDTISITSGTEKNITISAGGGTGDVSLDAKENLINVRGHEYTHIEKDKYEYFEADLYKYQIGGQFLVTQGTKFSFWLGTSMTINIALDVEFSAATKIALYILKVDIGMWKLDLYKQKIEFKDGKIQAGAWNTTHYFSRMKNTLVEAKNSLVTSVREAVRSKQGAVVSDQDGVVSNVAGPRNSISAIDNNM